jgi:hypothetical protein
MSTARAIYEDEFVTERADGSTDVRFSDEEWERMSKDPAFGYVHRCGHPTSSHERRAMETGMGDTHCHVCENEAEDHYHTYLFAIEEGLSEAEATAIADRECKSTAPGLVETVDAGEAFARYCDENGLDEPEQEVPDSWHGDPVSEGIVRGELTTRRLASGSVAVIDADGKVVEIR